MIKIIKEGTRKIATCESCGCMFSYENEDIEIYDSVEYCLGSRYKYVVCPQCDQRYILERTE